MKVRSERIIQRIETFAGFNNSTAGVSRFSYSKEDAAARKWLLGICNALNLSTCVDSVGNIRARYEGTDPSLAPILIGSHMDSVRCGGKYDGIVGVVGALEVLSVMREHNYQPNRSVELIVFAEEEGSNFGTTMVGSKALIGKLTLDNMAQLHTDDGRNCIQVMEDFGLHPQNIEHDILRPGDVEAMLELHIEQAIVLERMHKRLGVVKAIAGMTTLEVSIHGESNHAGATPMNLRHDPMCAAAALIAETEDIAAHQVLDSTVTTIGTFNCKPGMPNVICSDVSFTIDIRDIDAQAIETATKKIYAAAEQIAAARGVTINFSVIGKSSPILLSPRVTEIITKNVAECCTEWMPINSGAVHDAAMMAMITDVGMIFVPSVNGKSHNAEEYTAPEDIALGCQALLQTALQLCC